MTGRAFRTGLALLLLAATSTLPVLPAAAAPGDDGAARVRGDQWHLRYLHVPEANRISRGLGVTVAVPDTGVDPHPDLVRNLLPGVDLIGGGSGDGRDDRDSHGTAMAGLIAAHGGPGTRGALGIAPAAKILPIYGLPAETKGDSGTLASAIEWAVSHKADVISVSGVTGPTAELQKAVSAALAADIVVVAGVGNHPDSTRIGYPAAYNGVIAVGGVDRYGNHAAVSVTGSEIDIAAPAVDIVSTSIDGKYSKGTGTSSATAIVAGAAALIRSRYPKLSAEEVAHRLTATAVDKGPPGRDDQYGYGVIDLVAALTADVPPWGAGKASDRPAAPTTTPAGGPASTAMADPSGGTGDDGGATVRGLATLGVLVAAGGGWFLVRRRRRADDPPPRISR